MAAKQAEPDAQEILGRFSAATRAWFTAAFPGPTAAQLGAWAAISRRKHTLVVAPTGSGKTLSAFLWALDRLATDPPPTKAEHRCRVLYISPLKALAVDVERNLRSPLTGIRQAALRLGLPTPELQVAVRSGDTSTQERRAFQRAASDILITTPESLFLLLTSAARQMLSGVDTVIVDEVHALAGSKRGAHLALSLERLDALLAAPAQRIGLSATVRPIDEVARWLGGGGAAQVQLVTPPSQKEFDLRVVVPVPDLADLASAPPVELAPPVEPDLTGPAAGEPQAPTIWPHVEERVVDLIAAHRSTLVFTNSRRLAERLTARLNEVWAQRREGAQAAGQALPAPGSPAPGSLAPAAVMAQAGAALGAPAVLARAHHGSVSKEQRALIEGELKAGRLPAVVATSSLELGIDMGAVDLVVQVESPPSVAGGLQRVGRAGHQVGAVSRGVLFPKYRGDLVQTAVVVERMREGRIEALRVPTTPLDVLAQQIVAMLAMEPWTVDDLSALVARAAPFTSLTRGVLEAVLDMLSGRYPSDEFAELRPRIVWDRLTGILTGRPGAQRLAVTSGGTIPDRGLFGVFLAGADDARGATGRGGAGRRVGELDEEMVYESRVGDVFTLGSSSWRIEEITHDRVLVTPAPGQPGKLPFWHGDSPGRPAELGRAVGGFVRELAGAGQQQARERAAQAGLDEWAIDNLLAYLTEQRAATGQVPDDRTLLVERFRDELGDWRVVVHSPFGTPVHAPWALAIAARLRERFGVEVQAMPSDDGIVLRLPDVETADGGPPDVADLIALDPDEVEELVTAHLGGSALFTARFRECAARALLLPRRRPGSRQPLWQQRQRAAQLLEVAARYPAFPIVLEAVRECLQDVFDVPALVELMRELRSRRVRVREVETQRPSPFAQALLFGYVAQFLYEGDAPLAERRAAALSLDPTLLAELLGRGDGASLAELLDPKVVQLTEDQLQQLAPDRRVRDAEGVADLLRRVGPLSTSQVRARSACGAAGSSGAAEPGVSVQPAEPAAVARWLEQLEAARRVIRVRIAGVEQWATVEDAGRLRDALGTALPVGVAEVFTEPVPDPLADLLARYARTHGPFTPQAAAGAFGLGVAVVLDGLRRLVAAGRLVEGRLRPLGDDGAGAGVVAGVAGVAGGSPTLPDFCDAEVLRLLRRRSLAALRREVEPVPTVELARFLPEWQQVGQGGGRGVDGVLRAVEQLAGAVLPAGALETLILPGRVPDYSPGMLDELTTAGEVVWSGHGSLPGDDGWVALHPADLAPLTLLEPDGDPPAAGSPAEAVLTALAGGGAYFFRNLSEAIGGPDDGELLTTLWDLVWAGRVTNDSLAPLRARLSGGRGGVRGGRRAGQSPPRSRYRGGGRYAALRAARAATGRPAMPTRSGPPTAAGRWTLLPAIETDATLRAHAAAEILLERHGVVTRGAVQAERVPGGFAACYRVLSAFEEAGRVRRGYFVEGLGAAQFGGTGAIDRLRAGARSLTDAGSAIHPAGAPGGPNDERPGRTLVLAAADPANPYGAALPWPARPGTVVAEGTDASSSGSADGGAATTRTPPGHKPGRKAGALVVLVDGALALYVERGGRSLLSWTEHPPTLQAAADALALAVREGALGRLTVERTDGAGVLTSGQPLTAALAAAGFRATPRGLRIRG